MRVAVVGSRDFPKLSFVAQAVRDLPAGSIVISGGARGVDSMAERVAAECGLGVISVPVYDFESMSGRTEYAFRVDTTGEDAAAYVFEADMRKGMGLWFPTFAAAALHRNGVIVKHAEKVLAFHHRNSPGTANALGHAKRLGIPAEVVRF